MEALLRKPVPHRLQEWGLQVGLLLVAGFMCIALYNDVSRLF
jgi:regulator of sigma E protease